MTASPKFKKASPSPQMDMLMPTRVEHDAPIVEPEMITFKSDGEDSKDVINDNTVENNPFDSPKMNGSNVTTIDQIQEEKVDDDLSKNPFDDENDGWGDSDDDF